VKLILLTMIFSLTISGIVSANAQQSVWTQYKAAFIQNDGRVIDKWQGISHSEGQSYGMIISVLYDDKDEFDKIWQWTKNNLQVRHDNLFAWNWGSRGNDKWGVIDYNNATDGDIMISYALLKAWVKWQNAGYKAEALKVIEGIRKNLAFDLEKRTFLLPAYFGFNSADGLRLNPSYLIFSAFKAFSEVEDKSFWEKVYRDSRYLIEISYLGKFKLPPDWIVLNKKGESSLDGGNGFLFGYDAIRTLLYISWDINPKFPDGINEIFKIYEKLGYIPLYVDLSKNAISLEDASAGFYAVYALAAEKTGRHDLSQKLFKEAARKAVLEKDSYYSLSLFLLAAGSI